MAFWNLRARVALLWLVITLLVVGMFCVLLIVYCSLLLAYSNFATLQSLYCIFQLAESHANKQAYEIRARKWKMTDPSQPHPTQGSRPWELSFPPTMFIPSVCMFHLSTSFYRSIKAVWYEL